jgi:radical SAM protein with 4Fe4S-binding SPASM domain
MSRPRLGTIIFEVTQACDHACLHCYNTWNHPSNSNPGLDGSVDGLWPLMSHVLGQVDCTHVTLTGGEPLLYGDLGYSVGRLAELGLRVNLITNGHRLDEDLTAGLIQQGVTLFELPLLSFRREVHDALSGAEGAFDAVLSALAHIRYYQGNAVAVFVATRRNIADLYDTLRLAFAFGVRAVMLNRFNPGGRGAGMIEELLPAVAEMRAALEVADAAAQEFSLPISCSIPIQPCLIDTSAYAHLGFGYCAAGSERAYYTVDPAGNVRPCNHTPTVIGNAWEEPFDAIIGSERLARFAAARPDFCSSCDRELECQGGCKAAAEVCYGDLEAEEPFLRRNLDLARPVARLALSEDRY